MYMALFPMADKGCYVGQGGTKSGAPYAFDTVEQAKASATALTKSNVNVVTAPILIFDLDKLEIVSSVSRVPDPLPWVDRFKR